ncbi:hypothetical protein ABPG77_007754 [Micractinium sp. CCAP 211/92]
MAQFDTFTSGAQPTKPSKLSSLKGKVCVVGGGSGTVGSGIVRQLLLEGATVIAPLRRPDQADQLKAECSGAPLENLLPVVVDVSNEDVCQQFVGGCVQRYGRIDHAVACFGGFWEGGALTDQSVSELYRVIGDCATTHFIFAKHILPAMRQEAGSSFLFITGGAGERCVSPESSLYTVAQSTLYGIIAAAQAQYAEAPFRVGELRLNTFFKRHRELRNQSYQAGRGDWFGKRVYSNRKVGKLAAEVLLSGGRGERVTATPERLEGISLTV